MEVGRVLGGVELWILCGQVVQGNVSLRRIPCEIRNDSSNVYVQKWGTRDGHRGRGTGVSNGRRSIYICMYSGSPVHYTPRSA